MKILELELTNFGSHVHTKIEFGASTLVVGTLNAGKSSIAQAVEYALTGDCGTYRKKTDDRREIIHDLQPNKQLTVRLKTDKHEIIRTRAENGETWTFDGRTLANASAMDQAIADMLGRTKPVIAAALNVQHFLDMDPTAQKELVIGLTGAEVTDAKIRQLFTGRPEALAMLGGPINSLNAIANSYDYAYKQRTNVNRELKELKPPSPPEGVAPPIDKIRALLAQLETELQKKIAEQARAEGAANPNLRKTLLARQAELQNLQKPDTAVIPAMRSKIEAERAAKGYLGEASTMVSQKLLSARMDIAIREANILMLEKFNGRCVAGDHACPAPQSDMQKALEEQRTKLVKHKKDEHDFVAEVDKLAKQQADDRATRMAEHEIHEHEKAVLLYDRAQAELTTISEQLKNLPEGQSAVNLHLHEQIAQLRERLTRGRSQLEAATGWLERERQVKAVADQRAKLERELSLLEELVEFFGAKGVKAQLIDERIGKLEAEINLHLKVFGFEMKVQIEPWQIKMTDRPITRLSRSERFRLGLAFQLAIARTAGLNFVICDDTELLTPEVRGQMLGMIGAAKLDQAIIIMTLMDVPKFMETRPKMPKSLQVLLVGNADGVSSVRAI
jgi:DNA repair exonuclease SbcCD ATPase subunit